MGLLDLMLLTLSAPPKPEYEFKFPHEFPLPKSSAAKRYSPPLQTTLQSAPAATPAPPPPLATDRSNSMSAPHRGLPPPAAMSLPDPARPPPPITSSLGSMPNPPSQWQGAEESMKNWLAAKAEEDKRKQEEERTRQETLRLEQRKIESSMLRDSMAGGIPPHLVPMIFAGIGGVNLANINADGVQQYAAQLQSSQQQQIAAPQSQQVSPESRHESRPTNPTQYGAPPAPPQSSIPPAPQNLQGQPGGTFASYSPPAGPLSPRARSQTLVPQGPTSAPRQAPGQSALPRLTTNEVQTHQPQTLSSAGTQEGSSSPSIYFHHWIPPNSQSGSGMSRDHPAPPSDYASPLKKRKDARAHQPPPVPTNTSSTATQHMLPAFSHFSSVTPTPGGHGRGRHARNRSDQSSRGAFGSPGQGSGGHNTSPGNASSETLSRSEVAASTGNQRGSAASDGSRAGAGTFGSVPDSAQADRF